MDNIFSQNELLMCSLFNLKMFLFVLTILICCSCMMSCITPTMSLENFGNDDFFSYKDTINPGYFTTQTTVLTSETNSLIAGEATMYVTNDVMLQVPFYILDIYCYLYVINGNPLGQFAANKLDDEKLLQKYFVYLKNTKNGDSILLEQLKKDNDGIYKLHFKSPNVKKYIKYNSIEIVHLINNKETVILNGKLTLQ